MWVKRVTKFPINKLKMRYEHFHYLDFKCYRSINVHIRLLEISIVEYVKLFLRCTVYLSLKINFTCSILLAIFGWIQVLNSIAYLNSLSTAWFNWILFLINHFFGHGRDTHKCNLIALSPFYKRVTWTVVAVNCKGL